MSLWGFSGDYRSHSNQSTLEREREKEREREREALTQPFEFKKPVKWTRAGVALGLGTNGFRANMCQRAIFL